MSNPWATTNLLKNTYIDNDNYIDGKYSLKVNGKSGLLGGLAVDGAINFNTIPSYTGATGAGFTGNNFITKSYADATYTGGATGNFVTTDTVQTITANKTFDGAGITVKKTLGTNANGFFYADRYSSVGYYDNTSSSQKWYIDAEGNSLLTGTLDVSGAATFKSLPSYTGGGTPTFISNNFITKSYADSTYAGTGASGAVLLNANNVFTTVSGDIIHSNTSSTNYFWIDTSGSIGRANVGTGIGNYWKISETGVAQFTSDANRSNYWELNGRNLRFYNSGGATYPITMNGETGIISASGQISASGGIVGTVGSPSAITPALKIFKSFGGTSAANWFVDNNLTMRFNDGTTNKLSMGLDASGLGSISATNWTLSNVGRATIQSLTVLNINGITATTANMLIDFSANAPIMSGAKIKTATIPDTALSSNISLLNGNQTFSGQNTFTGGIIATATQTIDFSANAPIMSGANIKTATIPEAAISATGAIYCDLTNNQNVGGVKTFTKNLRAGSATAGDDVFQAFKNTTSGNAGHILINGDGNLLYYDTTASTTKWILNNAGKLTVKGGIDGSETQTIDFSNNQVIMNGALIKAETIPISSISGYTNICYLNGNNYFTTATGDLIRSTTAASNYFYINANGEIGIPTTGTGQQYRWKIQNNGTAYFRSNVNSSKYWAINDTGNVYYYNLGGIYSIVLRGDSGTIELNNSTNVVSIGKNIPIPTNTNESVFIGSNVATSRSSSSTQNVIIGNYASQFGVTCQDTNAVGYKALQNCTSDFNCAFGTYAGMNLVSGVENTFLGNASGGGLKNTCSYNFAMGSSALANTRSFPPSNYYYTGTTITADTSNNITLSGTRNGTIMALMDGAFSGVNGSRLAKVKSYNSSTNVMYLDSEVTLDQYSTIWFYDAGVLLASTTSVAGTTNTRTIATGLSISTSPNCYLIYWETSVLSKYVLVTSYNSTTGALVLDSAITSVTGQTFYFYNLDWRADSGSNINNSVACGKYSCSNITNGTNQNTSLGVSSLNGAGGSYNNINYLSGNDNTGVGYYAGANATGNSAHNTFIGSGSDVLDPLYNRPLGFIYDNATAVGYNAKVNNQSTALGGMSTASGTQSVAIGYSSTASGVNSVAIGYGATAAANEIKLGVSSQTLVTEGGYRFKGEIEISSTPYNLTASQTGYTIYCRSGSNIINLPNPTGLYGVEYTVIADAPNLSYSNNQVVSSAFSTNPFGGTSYYIFPNQSVRFRAQYSNGTIWYWSILEHTCDVKQYSADSLNVINNVATTLAINQTYSVFVASTAKVMTLPTPSAATNGAEIELRRNSSAGTLAQVQSNINVRNLANANTTILLTTTQYYIRLKCLKVTGTTYEWYTMALA